MEDNEFEDVLVISYTDRGSSILPQSTAERIMKNIRLEVTQNLKPDPEQKHPPSKPTKPAEPTLLDHISSKILSPNAGEDYQHLRVFHYIPSRHQSRALAASTLKQQPTDKCLLATNNTVSLVTASGECLLKKSALNINFVAMWHGLVVAFPYNQAVCFWDGDEEVYTSTDRYLGYMNAGVVVTTDEIFFLSYKRWITRVSRGPEGYYQETTLDQRDVADIAFCPRTKKLEYLDFGGVLTTCRGTVDVHAAIKPLISDMIAANQEYSNELLSLTKIPGRKYLVTSKVFLEPEDPRPCVMLIGGRTPTLLSHLVFASDWIVDQHYYLLGVRVLSPRGGITPLVCKQGSALFLLGVYNDRLTMLQTKTAVGTDHRLYNVTPVRGCWLLSTDKGELATLAIRGW